MKKLNLYAIVALAIVIVAFQSCKKDDELTRTDNTNTEAKAFNPKGIENMDEYLLGFMKKIKTATRDNETMTIEDAEWHLSACLNFQYCNANVERTCIEYDTITTVIDSENGNISLNAINSSLQEISAELISIYNYSSLDNKNILFVKTEILNENMRNGNTVRTIVAISGGHDFGYYYFDSDSIPLSLFALNEYRWDHAADTLEYYMNMFVRVKPTDPSLRIYYIITRTYEYNYVNAIGRVFYTGDPDTPTYICKEDMAFYLDSYLGLIAEGLNHTSQNVIGGVIPETEYYVSSDIIADYGIIKGDNIALDMMSLHHKISVYYGQPIVTEYPSPID